MVRASLKNPYAVVAISLIVVILGVVSYQKMVVDIFPEINVPVVAVATFYKGMGPNPRSRARLLCVSSNSTFRPAMSSTLNRARCPESV